MKKIIVLVALCSSLFTFKMKTEVVYAASEPTILVGRGINLVKAKDISGEQIIKTADIFDANFIKNQTLLETDIRESTSFSISEHDINSFVKNESASVRAKAGISLPIQLLTFKYQNSLSMNSSINHSEYHEKFFYNFNSLYKDYSLTLPGIGNNKQLYINNLSNLFVADLGKVYNSIMTPAQFFDIYGTHVLVEGIYGAKLEFYHTMATNSYNFSSSSSINLSSAIESALTKAATVQAEVKLDFSQSMEIDSNLIRTSTYVHAKGGNPIGVIGLADFGYAYKPWLTSVNDRNKAVLIDAGENGFLPIWELLPSQYASLKTIMSDYFISYAALYGASLADFRYNYNNGYKIPLNVRSFEVSITDSGMAKQHHDILSLQSFELSGSKVQTNYRYFDFKIILDVCEVDDGYQYVSLQRVPKGTDTKYEQKFSHGDKLEAYYYQHAIEFKAIPISYFLNMTNGKLYLGYGASGNGSDTWKNKNVRVEFSLYYYLP